MRYMLDTNVFIAAKNQHYGMDFCPGFWDWLVEANRGGRVFSIEKVFNEISTGDDELADWASSLGSQFFLQPTNETLTAMAEVSQWVTSNGYTPAAINTFLGVADFWLISQAKAGSFIVVSHEKPANTIHKVKIPNVCIGMGISVMTPFEMLRREKARFVMT